MESAAEAEASEASANVRIAQAAAATIAAGTARVEHGKRVGSALGPSPTSEGPAPEISLAVGEVEFSSRRACLSAQMVSEQADIDSEMVTFHDGDVDYWEGDDGWHRSGITGQGLPFNHPLWLLDALCGARGDATSEGTDRVRDVPTEHYRFTIDAHTACDCGPLGLSIPERLLKNAAPIPSEIWLDGDDRIRRMSYVWPHTRRRWYWKKFGPPWWTTTEFWDFGAQVDLAPPEHARPG